MIEKIKEDLVDQLVQEIRKSCPEYLCQDLVLTEVTLSCLTTDSTAAELSALGRGIGTQDIVRAFLQNLSNQQEPLILSVNGTIVQATPVVPPTTSTTTKSDNIVPIVAYSGCGLALVLLIVAVLLCCLWHW